MPVGPIELADVVGLDVRRHVGEIIARGLGARFPKCRACASCWRGKNSAARAAQDLVWRDGKAVKPAHPPAAAPPGSDRPPDPHSGK